MFNFAPRRQTRGFFVKVLMRKNKQTPEMRNYNRKIIANLAYSYVVPLAIRWSCLGIDRYHGNYGTGFFDFHTNTGINPIYAILPIYLIIYLIVRNRP